MTARYMLGNMTACYMPHLNRTTQVLFTGNVPGVRRACSDNWLVYLHGRVGTRSVGSGYSYYSTARILLSMLLLRSEAMAAAAKVTYTAPISCYFGSSRKVGRRG